MAISNNSTGLRPGVCTSTTRPTAPYEGQTIYETDTDLTYIWGGSAWQQVSGGTAVGNSGLVLVASQTVGSGVASVTVSNCFSSTYDNYKIVISGGVASTSGNGFLFSLAGIASGWYGGGFYMNAGSNTLSGFSRTGTSSTYFGVSETGSYGVVADVFSPFLTKQKEVTCQFSGGGTDLYVGVFNSHCNGSTSAASFTFACSLGTITGGTITVYGYRKA
jgi:hypothetical protein